MTYIPAAAVAVSTGNIADGAVTPRRNSHYIVTRIPSRSIGSFAA